MARSVSVSRIVRRRRQCRRAYVATFMAVTLGQYRCLLSLMVGAYPRRHGARKRQLWKVRFRALVHLVHSTMVNLEIHRRGSDGHLEVSFGSTLPSIPIPFTIWDELGGRGTWEWMIDQGILAHVSEPDHQRHLCREFRLAEKVIEGFLRAGLDDTSGRTVNAFTGKAVSRARRSPGTDENRHPWFRRGSVGGTAFEALSVTRCFVNLAAMKAEVSRIRRDADTSNTARSRQRALCAEAALLSVTMFGDLRREVLYGPGIYSYQPAYRPSYPGRLHEIGLGVQGCPRSVKAAAFGYAGVNNYDLTASLATSLLVVIGQYNQVIAQARCGGRFKPEDLPVMIDDRWLRRYISDPKRGSAWLAARIGVPKEVAKTIFYAVMFGGSIKRAVRDVLVEHFASDEEMVRRALCRVRRVLCHRQRDGMSSLVQMLDQVDDLVFSHINREGIFRSPRVASMITSMKVNRTRHGTSIVNAVGRSMMVLDAHGNRIVRDDDDRVAERHIRCHLTQGIEQEFIATVVIELLKEPAVIEGLIRIMSQQHDGLVVWTSLSTAEADRVVQQCVGRARASCALGQFARLEIKSIG